MLHRTLSSSDSKYNHIYIIVFFILATFGMNFLLPNYGGSGFNLPQNNMVAFFVVLLIGISAVKIIHKGVIRLSKMQIALLVLFLCLVIPGLFNYHSETQVLFQRIVPILGIFLLYISMEQFSNSKKVVTGLLYLVCLSAFLQVIYALAQKYLDLRSLEPFVALGIHKPFGIFQQYNVASSYFATAIIVTLYLITRTELRKKSLKLRYFNILFLMTTMLGSLYLVLLIGSRVALLGLLGGVVLFVVSQWKVLSIKRNFLILTFAIVTALVFINHKQLTVTYTKTISAAISLAADDEKLDLDRRAIIWKIASSTYLNSPWYGYGLGGFEKAFQDEAVKYHDSADSKKNKLTIFISHPHNEVIYWAIESGIVAILGLFGFLAYYFYLLFLQGWRHVVLWLAILAPIGLQTLVSYPFYMSAMHLVVFVLFLSLSVRQQAISFAVDFSPLVKKSLVFLTLCLVIVYASFTWRTLNGLLDLGFFKFSNYKQEQLLATPLKSIIWKKTAATYKNYLQFTRDARSHNRAQIDEYIKWLKEQIEYNENINLWVHLARAYQAQGVPNKALKTILTAKKRYPYDSLKALFKRMENQARSQIEESNGR